jgi:hypothetical protein
VKALEKIERERGGVDWFLSMLPTGPNRLPGDLDACLEAWEASGRQGFASFAVNPKEFGVMLKVGKSGGRTIIFDKGGCYWTSGTGDCFATPAGYRAYFEDQKVNGEFHILPDINTYQPVEPWQTLEVDTPEQWELCEFWFKRKIANVYPVMNGQNPYVVYGKEASSGT